MFSGLRSAFSETIVVQNKTKKALEHAYIRALYESFGNTTREIAEGTVPKLCALILKWCCILWL